MAIRKLDVESMLKTAPPPIPWLQRGFIAKGCVTLFTGEAGTGKSLLALALAQSVSSGTPFLDAPPVASGRAVVLDGENGEGELHRRIVGLGLSNVGVADVTNFSLSVNLAEMEEYLVKDGVPELLILDSARRLWVEGDENDSGEVSAMLMNIQQLARNFDMGIILLHHLNKGGTVRGSGAWKEVPEIVIEVGRWRKDKEESRRYMKWEKCRMGVAPSTKWVAFQSDNQGRVTVIPHWYPKKDELWPDS